ncbi:uncharacterized protein K02A2.6-like [Galleria mellonella]|uniref:RNA-directed DNA polymerase n=1 Tax=Galleria mellonella TaxID=7137 RepID=A0ABM3MXW3_GALME|nr:uncharacterized protein K02A2.6-like [Galleria mellonella]
MEVQFTQLMSSLAETLRTVQNQQAQMQTMFMQQQQTTSNNTVSGIVLQPYDELHESFGSYIQRLNNYINLKGVTSPVTKLQIFLNCIGAKYYQVLKNITAPDTLENKTYEQLVEILKNHIAPEPGEVAQQHKFCLRIQNENESIANYVAGLKEIGGKCNFICNSCKSTTFDTHLRVQFIRGLRSSEIKERKVDPVVGREWLRKLGVRLEINKIEIGKNDITEEQYKKNLEKLIDQYREIFSEEIGEIRNYTVKFSLKENVTPIFIKARPVPFALKEKVENEIDRLEKAGILEKVTYSQWGTPVVPVVKQNGSVRLCADYRATLNKNLLDDKYPIPRVEEVFSKLSGGRYFCTLDINQAYLHMKTDPATAEMQAISTCKGTFKVNRLMFGVKVAPNQWQRYMDQTLQGLPGTACFFDDIAIQGQTYIELLKRIQTIFQKLKECGLHLNKNKCQFLKKSITYLGHKINENGLHPTEEKVNDIKNSPRPTDESTLRTFLGMVNYYQQFIPNLASKLNPLYTLLQKNIKFIWSKECETSFQELKKEICSEKVLTPFHTHLPITLATDASPVGFGAVLSHIMPDNKERPIAFASRSLTSAEKGYSQLDKEAAALIWGLKKFFHYCYGRKITLIIDNQPLARILHPEKPMPTTTAVRLLHYANFLAGFDYNIKVRKSTEHANADYFSRLEHPTVNYNQLTDDDVFYLNQLTVLPVTFQKIKEATAKDLELQKLYQDIQSGTNYTKGLHEFSIQSNCIFYGIRIVIPKQLQPAILQELHTAHTGIVKMKALARSYVWWKNIDADIERMVNECKPCCLLQKNPAKIPIHSWEYPKEPWSRIHIDYAGPFFDQYFLIVVDAYTKWLEVIPTTSITTTATIKILKNLFTTFGLPITIVSDNGRQFRSEEMMTFLKENGIQSKFTAPFHPSTNGQAERYVQTFKNKIKSMIHEKGTLMEKLSRFLMMYRKTPNNTTGLSPAEMMFKREGDRVQIRFYDSNKWKIGKVIQKKGKLHYNVEVDGKIHTRHIDQIRRTMCTQGNDVTYLPHLPKLIATPAATSVSSPEKERRLNYTPDGREYLPDSPVLETSPCHETGTENNKPVSKRKSLFVPGSITENVTQPQLAPVATPASPSGVEQPVVLRRSTRIRKPTNRLNL